MCLYEASQTIKDPQSELKLQYVMWHCETELLRAQMTMSPCYCITGCRDVCGIETKLLGSRDGCGTVSYWEQRWMWHCDRVTGNKDACDTVTGIMGAGMAVAL